MKFNKKEMYAAAQKGFLNATDLADYLTKKGMPFRSAYKLVGALVNKCIASGKTLEDLTPAEYQAESPLFGEDVYDAISLETCVGKRISEGSTGPASVKAQILSVREFLQNEEV